jgi:hypothetical protein
VTLVCLSFLPASYVLFLHRWLPPPSPLFKKTKEKKRKERKRKRKKKGKFDNLILMGLLLGGKSTESLLSVMPCDESNVGKAASLG